jgi:hypothetical protein
LLLTPFPTMWVNSTGYAARASVLSPQSGGLWLCCPQCWSRNTAELSLKVGDGGNREGGISGGGVYMESPKLAE